MKRTVPRVEIKHEAVVRFGNYTDNLHISKQGFASLTRSNDYISHVIA